MAIYLLKEKGRMRVLVIGLGNLILGDDGVGIYLVRELREMGMEGVEFMELEEMGLGILDFIYNYDLVIIFDAYMDKKEGRIIDLTGFLEDHSFATSPHYTGLPEVLALSKIIKKRELPVIKIFGITVKDTYTLRESLSPSLLDKLPKLTKKAHSIIKKLISDAKKMNRYV